MKLQINELKNLITKKMSKTTIKMLSALLFLVLAFSVSSCKKDKIDGGKTGKTGTFTIEGVTYTGNTEVQTFANDNYSIVCQQDDPFKLIQVTFHNKAEAETGGTFDVSDYGLNVNSGTVQIGIDGNTYDPDGVRSINVSDKKITLTNVSLTKSGVGGSPTKINSASINF